MFKISNSEVIAWNTCKRKYYNEYILKLTKRRKSKALAIGIAGHEALQEYYKVRLEGRSHDEALSYMNAKLLHMLQNETETYGMSNLMLVHQRLKQYFDHYGSDDNWEILEVEKYYNTPVSDDFSMPMRLDLLVRDRRSGKVLLVDTKFTYDFWPDIKSRLSPQFPKYFFILRHNGINVDGVFINEIRYRENAQEIFKRTEVPITNQKLKSNLHNHVVSARQIVDYKNSSPETQKYLAVQLLHHKTCEYCSFKDLCDLELEGGNTDRYIAEQFQTNTYGYDKDDNNDSNRGAVTSSSTS